MMAVLRAIAHLADDPGAKRPMSSGCPIAAVDDDLED
jgi:hypothetical protein